MTPTRVAYRYAETDQEHKACFFVRRRVFIDGQNVPEDLEIDGLDDAALHVLAEENGNILGTARIRILEDIAKIERVAVLEEARGKGIGRGIMIFIIEKMAERRDIARLKLGSQCHAIPFYESLGFAAVGEVYMDAGIAHRDMVRDNQQIKQTG